MQFLPEVLNIYNVDEFRETLLALLETESDEVITLSAEKMEDIDGAGLQLIISFVKTAYKNDKEVKIIDKNNEIKKLFYLSGLNSTIKGLIK